MRQMWLQVQAQLGKLPPGTKVLIGALVTIVLLVMLLVSLWAGQSSTTPLAGVPADRQPVVLTALQSAGIKAEAKNGQIVVPTARVDDAFAILAQGELLSGNTQLAFDDFVKSQNPWISSYQGAQQFLLAKQKVLGQIIGKMVGVRSADVMLAMPEHKGFGDTHVRPSASVNMLMRGSGQVNRKLVEAVAGLVSGSVAGMQPQDVVVIDANQGKQFTVKSANDFAPGDNLENIFMLEQYHQTKIHDALSYIPDVIVAVNVRTDPVISKSVVEKKYDNEPLKSTDEQETETRTATEGGEPGVRPNTGLDIAGSGGSGTTSRTSKSHTDYDAKPILSETRSVVGGQTTKQISVTVNVPRSYFVSLYRQGKPADPAAGGAEKPAEPDEAALRPVVDDQLQQIAAQVKPLISSDAEGVVSVHMIPDARALMAMMPPPAEKSTAGVSLVLDSAWTKPVGMGLLALMSLALMLGMVRKATQQLPMPTVEELAGVPPPLPMEDDLIGEADAQEPSMAGMELNEDEIRSRKVAEQIADMVKSNPAEAASLFNRWIRKEE
ncbi:MAG: hypothetical protein K8S99_17130 [Planctomycetes bacterium]|nr:hypothetical protein [Planctomycetota bacterium]